MPNMFARGIHASWLASLRRPTNRFISAMREPEKAQGRKLLEILTRHAHTAYGQEHGFERVDRAFNHFHVFPAPVRQRFPGPYIGLSETLTRWCPSLGRAFAVNYIGKYSLARG